MKNLIELYQNHAGKVTDKWALYLREYDRLFVPYREKTVSILEVGIQNGGSLEIWSEYFPYAERIVGCDIDPNCANLKYEDTRISVIIGDATTSDTQDKVLGTSDAFDIIIEDGSHTSSDIVKTFAMYFPYLKCGGVFVIEDLHCSYWQEYEGGIFHPYSSIAFFKNLTDLVNHEHWGIEKERSELLKGFGIEIEEAQLQQISSIEFINSICIVRKKESSRNLLGSRVVAGKVSDVEKIILNLAGAKSEPKSQRNNSWSTLMSSPAESYLELISEINKNLEIIYTERSTAAELKNAVKAKQSEIEAKQEEINYLYDIVRSFESSKSWRYTKPIRFISNKLKYLALLLFGRFRARNVKSRFIKLLKLIYWNIPVELRTPILNWSYRNFSFIFRGMAHYESWKNNGKKTDFIDVETLLTLDGISPAVSIDGKIGIHLHMYYADLAIEFSNYLKNIPFDYDLYISTKDVEGKKACLSIFSKHKNCKKLIIEVVENRGRDIAPMFCTFGKILQQYDYIAHLHTKKSLYNSGATEGWRQYLQQQLLGSPITVRKILNLLNNGKGLVYPQNFHLIPYMANTWLANKSMGVAWCARLGINPVPQGYFDFPAGSMFWARRDALQPLFNANITINDFSVESGQTDGTFAHCLERLLALCARNQGYQIGIIKDSQTQSWSSWRLDQSISRSFQFLREQISNSQIRCIGFDIFDTLLIRPLINADSTKRIIAANLPVRLAQLFEEYRDISEREARNKKGKDVDLFDIYQTFQNLTSLCDEDVNTIFEVEAEIEFKSLSARADGVNLYKCAKESGKQVVLISDMFLPEHIIIRALKSNGIEDWSFLYLSNKVGVRKDSGLLYEVVLKENNLKPSELLMIGDNERSDFQIPCDKKIIGMHIMRSVEIARGMPRLRSILEETEFSGDINAELTLGLLISDNYSNIVYSDVDPTSLFDPTAYKIGFNLVGPLLASTAQWLINEAKNDGVEHLYFLAREGKIMKDVYDLWAEKIDGSPTSSYLTVSRRACSVPLIENFDDILRIAKSDYYPNHISSFLIERFGLELTDDNWYDLSNEVGIDKNTICEIRNENLDKIIPILMKVSKCIYEIASKERENIMRYLTSAGLINGVKSAVVDVGYGASIQSYLCRLTNLQINGYYLMTDERAEEISKKHNVLARGCYIKDAKRAPTSDVMYLKSFELEKLLSSNDGQVIKFIADDNNFVHAECRELSIEELSSKILRDDLHKGAMQFVKNANQIRQDLLQSFTPSINVSKALVTEFLERKSDKETVIISKIKIDDHYCGRGIV